MMRGWIARGSLARPLLVLAVSAASLAACGAASEPARAPAVASSETSANESSRGAGDDPRSESATSADPVIDPAADAPEANGASAPSPLDPAPLDGPYASLDDYLLEHPVDHHEDCGARPKPSSKPQTIGASGAVREGRIVRAPGSFACAPAEYCLLGLRTAEGWFVRRSPEPCHGVTGPETSVSVPKMKTRWVRAGEASVLAIEETQHASSREITEARGVRNEENVYRESRYLLLCGIGVSGKPSCTREVVLACPNAQASTSEVGWSLSDGQLVLASDADENVLCTREAAFVVGTFPLAFP